jgi:uncharacterized membrane protein YjdF
VKVSYIKFQHFISNTKERAQVKLLVPLILNYLALYILYSALEVVILRYPFTNLLFTIFFFCFVYVFVTGSGYVAQSGLELAVLWIQSPEC